MRPASRESGWKNRALVRERDAGRVRWLWWMLRWMLIAAAPAAAALVSQNECLQISYQVNALTDQRKALEEQQRALAVDLARLESLARVERWARREAGLVRPPAGRVVVVRRETAGPPDLLAETRGRQAAAR